MVKSLCDHRKEGKNTCLEALKPVCRRVGEGTECKTGEGRICCLQSVICVQEIKGMQYSWRKKMTTVFPIGYILLHL